MQVKLESTGAGRALLSFMLVITLAAIVVANLPESEIKTRLYGVAKPYLFATGLDQHWAMFSPNPRPIVFIESHIDYSDGSSSIWPIPAGHGLSAYRHYRWHKFGENLRLDENDELWTPFAKYVARRARAEGRDPVRVTLVRRVAELLPPGPGPDRRPWEALKLFTLHVQVPS